MLKNTNKTLKNPNWFEADNQSINQSMSKYCNIITALSKCFVAVGTIEGVVGSKHQVPLPARGLLVKSNVE